MRPTSLQFRSPKEKTGEYVLPIVTCNGSNLWEGHRVRKKQTFYTAKRFSEYEIDANRMGSIGPGSYNLRENVKDLDKERYCFMVLAKPKFYINSYKAYDLDPFFQEYHRREVGFNYLETTPTIKESKQKRSKTRSEVYQLPYLKN